MSEQGDWKSIKNIARRFAGKHVLLENAGDQNPRASMIIKIDDFRIQHPEGEPWCVTVRVDESMTVYTDDGLYIPDGKLCLWDAGYAKLRLALRQPNHSGAPARIDLDCPYMIL